MCLGTTQASPWIASLSRTTLLVSGRRANLTHHEMKILKLSCGALFFTAARNGGGIVLFTPYDVQPDYNLCEHPPTYFTYYYQTTIRLSNSVLTCNSAPCLTCSGGGLHLDRGGQLILRYCTAFSFHIHAMVDMNPQDMVVWNPAPTHHCPPPSHTPHPTPPSSLIIAVYLSFTPPPSPCMGGYTAMSPLRTTPRGSSVVGCRLVSLARTQSAD